MQREFVNTLRPLKIIQKMKRRDEYERLVKRLKLGVGKHIQSGLKLAPHRRTRKRTVFLMFRLRRTRKV